MSSFSSTRIRPNILWVKVWGLALMQGAIALMWVIYNLYLVDLLTQFGFSAAMATGLLVIENLLAIVMEPLMGALGDRLQQQLGTRLPLISFGAILAVGAFLRIPVIALSGLSAAKSWVLPLMMVAWALTMTIFRSPALSLLGRCAFGTRLPQAASILTLVGGLAGATGPLASTLIVSWGPLVAFGIGSGVLLLTTAILWLTATSTITSPVRDAVETANSSPENMATSSLALVFGAGVGIALGFRTLMLLFSRVVNQQIPNSNASLILGSIFMALAITAIPAGTLAVRLGNRRAMVGGLALLAFVTALVGIVQSSIVAIALAILFGAAFSLVSNGTIPFALSMVPASKAALGTGMFFGGGAAAASLFGAIAGWLKLWPLGWSALLGLLGLSLAGLCIACSPRRLSSLEA
jgi:MFS family permease